MHKTPKRSPDRPAGPRLRALAVLASALLILASCAGPSSTTVLEEIEKGSGSGRHIKGVPFFPQEDYMCGPSAMASIMGYYGERTSMAEVAEEVYMEKLRGTLPMDLFLYAKDRGFDAKYYRGSLDDLRQRLREGTPPILFIDLGQKAFPAGHYIVATGFSDTRRVIIAHSGRTRDDVIGYERLLGAWEKTGYSTLLITPGPDGP